MSYKIQDLLNDIRDFDNTINPKVTKKGTDGDVDLFEVLINEEENISFHLGVNLIFFRNNHPRAILKFLPLITKEDGTKFVIECLMNMKVQLNSPPNVASFARKYLGNEVSVKKQKEYTQVEYAKFILIITEDQVFLIGKNKRRVLASFSQKEKSLEEIFKSLKFFAQDIEKVDI